MKALASILIFSGIIKLVITGNLKVTDSEIQGISNEFAEDICKCIIVAESIIQIFCSAYIISVL